MPTPIKSAPRWRDLVELLAPVPTKLICAALLQGLAAAASIVPFVCVVEIARRLRAAGPPDEDAIRALVVTRVRDVTGAGPRPDRRAELLAESGIYADFRRERTRARSWRIAAEPAR
jgi:hypothetical protein